MQTLEHVPIGERFGNAVMAYDRYLLLAFWPSGLSIFYPRLDPEVFTAGRVALALLPLVAVTSFAIWQWKQRPYLLVGWSWFLVTLVPVIGIVQIGEQSIADRYTYLPYVGLSIACVWGVESFWPRHPRRDFVLIGMALFAVFAGGFAAARQRTLSRPAGAAQ